MGEWRRRRVMLIVLAVLVVGALAGGGTVALLRDGGSGHQATDDRRAAGNGQQPAGTAAATTLPTTPPPTSAAPTLTRTPPASASRSPTATTTATRAPAVTGTGTAATARGPLSERSLEWKVGQLFMLGFEGTNSSGPITRLIGERHAGGVVLLGGNIGGQAQLRALTDELQALARRSSGVGLLISADQEGGIVQRLPYTSLPSARQMAAQGPAAVRGYGQRTAQELRAGGVNMDLAPVLDVNDNPANPVIGSRAFGVEAQTVIENGLAFLQGLQDGGVAGVAKHFPGHGNTSQDSHLTLPYVNKSDAQLRATELAPFAAAVQHGVEAVMIAHVVYPAWDAANPASLSRAIITGILRNELGYMGVIMTDDMNMRAITDRLGPGEAAVQALTAGADIILLAGPLSSQEAMMDAVLAAVRAGRISEARLDESVQRVQTLKQELGLAGR